MVTVIIVAVVAFAAGAFVDHQFGKKAIADAKLFEDAAKADLKKAADKLVSLGSKL